MNFCRKLVVLALGLALGTGCASALEAIKGDLRSEVVSIVVDNQSPEALEIYLASARTGSIRLGLVFPLSRRVFRPPIGLLQNETTLYSRPSNGSLGPADVYASVPFVINSPREVFWAITTGRRLSAVEFR